MINARTIAKPSTFVRKMVDIYGQVVKILTVCPGGNVLIRTKWTVTHFVRGKAGFYGQKCMFLNPPPLIPFYPWPILRCPRQTPDAITMNLQNRKSPYTTNAPHFHERHLAVRKGLEPSTPGVTGPYSNQLNYRTRSCCVWFVSQTRMQSYV